MKRFFLLSAFLFFAGVSAQKVYEFDCILEYSVKLADTSMVKRQIIMTNSKDNNYFAFIDSVDGHKYEVTFYDYNSITAKSTFSKEMPDSENLIFQCNWVALAYYQKNQLRNYDFTVANDTLIDGKSYGYYYLRSVKLNREKRKNLSILNWVIEPGTEYHLPLLIHPTAFAEWKSKPNLPNGIPKLYYYFNPNTGRTSPIYRLVKITRIHKTITIPEDCQPVNILR